MTIQERPALQARAGIKAEKVANLNIKDLLTNPDADLAALIGCDLPRLRFKSSQTVFPSGHDEPVLLLVTRGRVSIFVESDGDQAVVKRVGKGTLLGEMRSLGMTMLGCRARADGDCRALLLDRRAAHALYRKTSLKWGRLQLPMLFDCLQEQDRILFGTIKVRLAALLLDLADESGSITGVTQQRLAKRLGVHRESMWVALAELREEGLVRWGRSTATVEISGLTEIVEGGRE
jgi:CRP-like cAMP-binding protein